MTVTQTLDFVCGLHNCPEFFRHPLVFITGHANTEDVFYCFNVKDKDKLEDGQGAVYKNKCCNCNYSGETGRNLSTRLTEHKRATRNSNVNNY